MSESKGAQNLSRRAIHLTWIFAMIAASESAAFAQADPEGSGVIIGAVNWLQGTLLGTVATVVAVIAVASIGFMMLTGRMNWRHGAVVILGCFILFGAASIVAGIRASVAGG
jgi:type IV secretory pathway VirB2 component (pilin)